MMSSSPFRILSIFVAILQFHKIDAAGGYHYNPPAQPLSSITAGHHFAPLPTIAPLPPIPAIPPLPTGRPAVATRVQTLVQTHPAPQNTYTASKSIANAYLPPNVGRPQNTYLPPSTPVHQQRGPAFSSAPNHAAGISARLAEVAPEPQSKPGIFGQRIQPLAPPSFPSYVPPPNAPQPQQLLRNSPPANAQPLRFPYGQQAVNNYPRDGYELGGRQLKQYAVVEIIDNDIEQDTRPFLKSPFIDNYRAQIGASGTGAAPSPPGQQITSQANALVLEQQRLAQPQLRSGGGGDVGGGRGGTDAVALGSGGLGIVRLANGNVYLGSGSLGYISGQQHNALIQEARTRMGARMPDPLHFGHGPLGYPGQDGARRFRF